MMSTTHRKGTAAIAGIALCAVAARVDALPPPPYAVFDIGQSLIGRESSGIDEAGVQSVGSDRRDTGYAFTLGWRFSPHLAAEGSFAELGEARYTLAVENGGPVSNPTVRVRSSGVVLSLAGTWPIHERWSLEGRAGAYLGKTETRLRGTVTHPLGSQAINNLVGSESRVGLAAGVGAVAAINDTWALRVGYDYLDTAFGKHAQRIAVGVRFNWP